MNRPAPPPTLPAAASADAAAAPLVLCVDDEPHVLSALRRALRGSGCTVLTAGGGTQALDLLRQQAVQLVVCDMRMPGMNGNQVLEAVQQQWPDVVRVVLTGQADLQDAIASINRGSVFRYLRKPWDDDELRHVVRQGLERRALEDDRRRLHALTAQRNAELQQANALLEARVAERTAELAGTNDRLKQTYIGTVKVFSNLIELRSGRLLGHGRRVADTARRIGQQLGYDDAGLQELTVAGLLHDLGFIGLPDLMLNRPAARLDDEERKLYRQHPAQGEQLLMALDDMQGAAALIRSHHERWDGQGFPDGLQGTAIPLGARILALADAVDAMRHGLTTEVQLNLYEARALVLRQRGQQFDPEVVDAFLQVTQSDAPDPLRLVLRTSQIEPGMVLAADLVSHHGLPMLTAGQVLSASLISRICAFEAREGQPLTLCVRPAGSAPSLEMLR